MRRQFPPTTAAMVVIAVWVVLSVFRIMLPLEHGLRAYYFKTTNFSDTPVSRIDPEVSSAQIYTTFGAQPPEQFAVRWEGYLQIDRPGRYRFAVAADDSSRLFIDGALLVDNPAGPPETRVRDADGFPIATAPQAAIDLGEGAHAVRVEFVQDGGRFTCEWLWAEGDAAFEDVPGWRLSVSRRSAAAALVPWIDRMWWLTTLLVGLVLVRWIDPRQFVQRGSWRWQRAGVVAAAIALAVFYVVAATEHGRRVNTVKGRADQTGYLGDAQQIYANWHGLTPPILVGQRMRMPAYAGVLALFWDPGVRNWEFFEFAKALNVWMSLVLLVILWWVAARHLPPIAAANFVLVTAFGIFIFKAGYMQPELLFYFFFFLAFLATCLLFTDRSPRAMIGLAILAGGFSGAAYLTKALTPPFVALFAVLQCGRGVGALTLGKPAGQRGLWRIASAVVTVASFLAVIAPYIVNNKRVFGEYFFNQNTTYYIWYDTGVRARIEMIPSTDIQGVVHWPEERLPSMRKYWQTHSIGQIVRRLVDGLSDIAVGSYESYGFLKYLVVYVALAVALVVKERRAFVRLVAERSGLILFLVFYGGLYLASTAFFVITSGTGGMRFILAHAAPLFFALAAFSAQRPFRDTTWSIGPMLLTTTRAQYALLALIGFDVTFLLWDRLMTTYGGF